MSQEIYFDNAATTIVDEAAANLCYDVMRRFYGNPSSVHDKGIESSHILNHAREQVTTALGYDKRQGSVIFTSSGTEANNTAIFSCYKILSKRYNNMVISDSEHPSVENCARILEKSGVSVRRIPTKNGKLDLEKAQEFIDSKTFLVSCMLVNNETGALYDLSALKKIKDANAPGAFFHTDAVQAFANLPFKLSSIGADFISLSGHKIHSPKGIGALWIKKDSRLLPRMIGGGQESGLRSGTENVAGIASFGLCCKNAYSDLKERLNHFDILNVYARQILKEKCLGIIINSNENCASHILSVSLPGVRSEILLRFLSQKGIFVSAGSACSSSHADNRVLSAFGLDSKTADSTIRISFSKYNTKEEISILADAISLADKTLIHTK